LTLWQCSDVKSWNILKHLETSKKHLRNIWETSEKNLGNIWETADVRHPCRPHDPRGVSLTATGALRNLTRRSWGWSVAIGRNWGSATERWICLNITNEGHRTWQKVLYLNRSKHFQTMSWSSIGPMNSQPNQDPFRSGLGPY
jgi:hypothetical protein